jgi:hypothetical protein
MFFFDILHVKDSNDLTLEEEIFFVLFHHNLYIQDIRGQGYGTSNRHGEWNDLQSFIY